LENHVTIRLPVGHFLWVVYCDHSSIWHSCGDMAPQKLDERTHAQTDARMILYSVQCDTEQTKNCNISDTTFRQTCRSRC